MTDVVRGRAEELPEERGSPGEAVEAAEPLELWDDSGYVALALALSLFLTAVFSLAAGPLGSFFVLVFGFYVVYFGQRLFRRKPRLRITDEGLVDENFWYSPGLIPWENIVDISESNLGLIDVELRDETAFFEGLSPLQAIPRLKMRLWGFGSGTITPWLLQGSREEVLEVLQSGLDAYTLRSGVSSPAIPAGPVTEQGSPRLPNPRPSP